jgi:hypothetical protein
MAVREAARNAVDIGVKSEIVAAATLAGGFKGRRISILEFVKQLGLSSAAVDAINTEL